MRKQVLSRYQEILLGDVLQRAPLLPMDAGVHAAASRRVVKSQHSEASDLETAALALEEDACCGCVVNKRPVGEGLKGSESVEYGGRAVVALATAPDVMEKTERALHTRDLGREYGFTDIDGKEPLFYEGCEGWSAT